jgi:type I restriction enzyme R subunit
LKKGRGGHRLTVVEEQSSEYANAKLKYLNNDSLPFVYESTGVITRFTDYRDPKPRGRNVFHFHQPGTIEWLKKAIVLEHVYRTLSLR